jgi:OmpW family
MKYSIMYFQNLLKLLLFYKMKKPLYCLFLFLGLIGQFSNTSYSQEIEDEIPVYKIIEPITVQKSYQISVRPSYLLPLNGTKSYINKAEIKFNNISFEINNPKNYSIGIEIGQHYFRQNIPRATYDYDGTLVSSMQTRTTNNTPLTLIYSKYYTPATNAIRPYLQMGAGAVKINYKNYWGYVLDEKIRYAPLLAPAVGVKIKLDKTNYWVLDARIKYMLAPFKYDFISKFNYLSLDLSLGFRWWDEK